MIFKRRINPSESLFILSCTLEEFLTKGNHSLGAIEIPMRAKIYQKYHDAKARCYNKKHKLYPHYGGRGLKVEFTKLEFTKWFLEEYKNFYLKHHDLSPSLSRIDYRLGYTLDNISLESISENTKELYHRRGNPTKTGTKLDEIDCLVCYTYKDKRKLADFYGVSFQAIAQIQKGVTRPNLHSAIHGVS